MNLDLMAMYIGLNGLLCDKLYSIFIYCICTEAIWGGGVLLLSLKLTFIIVSPCDCGNSLMHNHAPLGFGRF